MIPRLLRTFAALPTEYPSLPQREGVAIVCVTSFIHLTNTYALDVVVERRDKEYSIVEWREDERARCDYHGKLLCATNNRAIGAGFNTRHCEALIRGGVYGECAMQNMRWKIARAIDEWYDPTITFDDMHDPLKPKKL